MKHCKILKSPQTLEECSDYVENFIDSLSSRPYELEIMRMYDSEMERVDIVEHIAKEHDLTFVEAEPIVNATILQNSGMVKI